MDAKSIEQTPPGPHYTLKGLKPFINYKNKLSWRSSLQFKKDFTKYVYSVEEPHWRNSPFTKQIKQLKLVRKVDAEEYLLSSFKVSQIIKTLKPLRKHIKHIITSKDHILAHFPYLSQYKLTSTPLSWKIFLSCRAVKVLKIHCEFRSGNEFEVSGIKRFRRRFGKVINNSKSLEHLKLYGHDRQLEIFALWMLSPIIPSLKCLKSFVLSECLWTKYPRLHNRILKKILNQVTHFQGVIKYYADGHWSCNPLDFNLNYGINTLKNLAELSLESEQIRDIRPNHLQNLTEMKKLYNLKTLNLNLEKFFGFTEFFNYFRLPKQIESITLRLEGFEWDHRDFQHIKNISTFLEKNRKYQTFFNQWNGLDRLKNLTFTVESREDYASKFVACILKRLHSLETLSYKQEPSKDDSCYYRYKLVSFKDIWEGLEGSRLTLQEVSITARYLSLSQIKNLSFDMPKLKSLSIESQAQCSCQDLIELFTKLLGLDIILSLWISPDVFIQSDKSFTFSDSLQNKVLNLRVFVKAGKPETFTKSFCRLLDQNSLEGSLCIIVPEKLEQAAVRNTSLSQFKMMLSERFDELHF